MPCMAQELQTIWRAEQVDHFANKLLAGAHAGEDAKARMACAALTHHPVVCLTARAQHPVLGLQAKQAGHIFMSAAQSSYRYLHARMYMGTSHVHVLAAWTCSACACAGSHLIMSCACM